ncbi:hypothetical protein D3C76_1418630 [compost metagenome]
MRLCFCPWPISMMRRALTPALLRAASMPGRLLALDTRLVNHSTCCAYCTLSPISCVTKRLSPPSHHSSLFCPPKLSTGSFRLGSCLPRFFHLRWLPRVASSREAWKGGLHRVRSKRSSACSKPLRMCLRSPCWRRAMPLLRPLAWTMALAEASATGSMSLPTKRQR